MSIFLKVVNELLKDDLEKAQSKQKHTNTNPCEYYHKIFFKPEKWMPLEELSNKIVVHLLNFTDV